MISIGIGMFIAAFSAGFLMFLAPCTFPLVPAFLASLTPQNASQSLSSAVIQKILLRNALIFCIGFMLIFVLLGALSGLFGSYLEAYKDILIRFGGVMLILFGLGFTGIFSTPLLKRLVSRIAITGNTAPLLLGITFALGWSPCTGPLLASILLLATGTATLLQGTILLFVFSLGLLIPFMLTAFFYTRVVTTLQIFSRYERFVRWGSSTLVILVGMVLVFGDMMTFTHVGAQFYSYFGYVPQCVLY